MQKVLCVSQFSRDRVSSSMYFTAPQSKDHTLPNDMNNVLLAVNTEHLMADICLFY